MECDLSYLHPQYIFIYTNSNIYAGILPQGDSFQSGRLCLWNLHMSYKWVQLRLF